MLYAEHSRKVQNIFQYNMTEPLNVESICNNKKVDYTNMLTFNCHNTTINNNELTGEGNARPKEEMHHSRSAITLTCKQSIVQK